MQYACNDTKQFYTRIREHSISIFSFVILAFSIVSISAQESAQAPVQSTEAASIKTPQEFVVVPLLQTLPTIATLKALAIYHSILSQAKDNIELRIVFGEEVSIAQVPVLFKKYLLEYDYDSVIFVSATSQVQQDEAVDSALLEGVKNLETNFVVDVQMYRKGSTEAIYVDQYQGDFANLKTSLLAEQTESDVDADIEIRRELQEHKALLDMVNTIAKEVQYTTIYINPEAESRPEYILKINKEPVFFSDYEKGVAYFSLAKQQVFVYQILSGEEMLVKKFKTKSDEENKSVEVVFLDSNKPRKVVDDKLSTDVLGGYSYPLYSTQTSIFYPSVLAINKIQYHSQWKKLRGYVGSTVQFTVLSVLPSIDATINSRYGIHLTSGFDFDFAKSFVFHTGLAMGGVFLTSTSIEGFNYIPESVMPSLGIDLGLTYHILTLRHGSMRLITELAGRAAYHVATLALTTIESYIAAQVSLGLGWRF